MIHDYASCTPFPFDRTLHDITMQTSHSPPYSVFTRGRIRSRSWLKTPFPSPLIPQTMNAQNFHSDPFQPSVFSTPFFCHHFINSHTQDISSLSHLSHLAISNLSLPFHLRCPYSSHLSHHREQYVLHARAFLVIVTASSTPVVVLGCPSLQQVHAHHHSTSSFPQHVDHTPPSLLTGICSGHLTVKGGHDGHF